MPPRRKAKQSFLERQINSLDEEQQKSKQTSNTNTVTYTAADLLTKAEAMMIHGQYELANSFLERAVEIEPNNCQVLGLYGDFLLHSGDFSSASTILKRCIELEPDAGAEKFMNYGQAVGGDEAIASYNKGIEILERDLASLEATDDIEEQKKLISSAYCSIAELYLTDLCQTPEAEEACGQAITKALEYFPTSAEALQIAASYNISCKRNDEALDLLNRSHAIWAEAAKEAHATDNDDEPSRITSAEQFEEIISALPSYEFRFDTAKLYMELGQPKAAIDICEQLVGESDDIVDVWAFMARVLATLEQFEDALECIDNAQTLFRLVVDKDSELENQVAELRAAIEPHVELNDDDDNVDDDNDAMV